MSEPFDDLERAIQTYIASHYEGAMTDSWFLVVHAQNIEAHDVSNYRVVSPPTQPLHTDAGLAKIGELIIRDSWDSSWDDGDD